MDFMCCNTPIRTVKTLFFSMFLANLANSVEASPVTRAISPSGIEAEAVAELVRPMGAADKKAALERLDRLDRAELDAAGLVELGEAYTLLGRGDEARASARVALGRGPDPTAEFGAIRILAAQKDYAAAENAAREALRRSPGDRSLLALLHEVKGRSAPARSSPAAVHEAKPAAPREARAVAVKAVKTTVAAVAVPNPIEAAPLAYVPIGARKPWAIERAWLRVQLMHAQLVSTQSSKDAGELARIKAALDRSETGRVIVAELGGWDVIEASVDVRMADLPRGMGGLAIPGFGSKRPILLMSRRMSGEPEAMTASILAHELTHIADFGRGEGIGLLAIPSELNAHRIQARTFLELKTQMSPDETRKAGGRYYWDYSVFLSELWQDRITSRYPDKDAFMAVFPNMDVSAMAGAAYADLAKGAVMPGSPHVDRHLTAPVNGMYTVYSWEKDIADIVAAKVAKGKAPTSGEAAIMARRAEQMRRVDADDAVYRKLHGYEVSGGN
jgi:tetratricopeptide (TPR) repeat protein